MKRFTLLLAMALPYTTSLADSSAPSIKSDARILYLHHSTGGCVWNGGVENWLKAANESNGTHYQIEERAFPTSEGYGWANYPYDYWNIWVNHAGDVAYKLQPTLEMLVKDYDVISFKQCFPVCYVEADTGEADVASDRKSLENYKLQYAALKEKLHSFPDTTFIVWTGAALVEQSVQEDQARRAREFFTWVKEEWDEPGDNIFVWDFHALQTEGGLYFKDEYAMSVEDSHPNETFSAKVAPLFGQRLMNILSGKGDSTSLTGE